MDPRDRKRDFSNAFEISHDPYRKALRGITGSTASRRSSFDTPIVIFGSNKENKEPFFDTNAELKQLNVFQAYMHQPLAFHFTGPRVELPYDGMDLTARERPMPLSERGRLHINPSPFEFSSSSCSSPPFGDVLASYTEPGPVIFEDPDPDTVHDQPDRNGLVTPTTLSFQDLSLQETPQTWFPGMHQLSVGATRTSVFMVESKSLHCYFSNLHPEDIVIYYDKGKQVMKVNKSLLNNASFFFAVLINGPSLEDHTRCLRLRGDFPYAITAMVQYLENSIYAFDPYMRTQYPHITLLDLHIHAYIVGTKYHVRRLCDHAMDEYLNIGQMVLSMGITIDGEDVTDFTTEHSAQVNATSSVSAVVNHFLDSLVLIWRNTPQRGDALRDAVLELLKPYLPQLLGLKFFQTLMMEMAGFGDDVVQSLAEDGFDVKAFPVLAGFHEKGGVWFSGA